MELLFCVITIVLACQPVFAQQLPLGEIPIGINSFDPFANPETFDEDSGWYVAELNELGIQFVRLKFPWNQLEKTPGQFDWVHMDKVVQAYSQAGIRILGVITGPCAWAEQGASPANEIERYQFAQFVNQVVARYKKQAGHWEIWDSPNLQSYWRPEPNPGNYANTARIAYPAAINASTDCRILAPSLAGCDTEFLEDLYPNGIRDYFHLLSSKLIVPVGHESTLQDCVDQLERVMLRHERAPKSIWITGLGISQPPETEDAAEQMEIAHAETFVRTVVEALSERIVDKVFLSTLIDIPIRAQHLNLGLARQDKSRRLAFTACKNMIEQIGAKPFLGEVYVDPSMRDGSTEED